MLRRVLVIFAMLSAVSCNRGLKKDETVCPEYRNLKCIAGVRCSMDKKRGCRVCECDRLDQPSSPLPPDDDSTPPR